MKEEAVATTQAKEAPSFLAWLRCVPWPWEKPQPEKAKKPSRRPHMLVTCVAKTAELERVFRCIDENGDGKISPTEIQNCVRTLGEELSAEDAEALVASTDSDGDGLLGLDDFTKLVEGSEEGEEEKGKTLREAFRVYEMEGEGCITPRSLRRALVRLGESRTIDECTVMIRRFDINGDGVISFDEFKVMML